MTIEKQIQLDIMNMVFQIEDLDFLSKIRKEVKSFKTEAEIPAFMEAVEPIRDHIPLEEIMEKQNYKPIDYQTFRKKVGDFDWGMPIESVLEELKD